MARKLTLKILNRISGRISYDSNFIRDEIQKSELSIPDKKLTWELVNGILKNKKFIDYILDRYISKKPNDQVINVLRLGMYQILFTRIPDYASINESVELIKIGKFGFAKNFVNGVLRNIQRDLDSIKDLLDSESIPDDIKYSIPEWLVKRFADKYGKEKSRNIFSIVARPPLLTVRVSEEDPDNQNFKNILDSENIEYKQIYDSKWFLILNKEKFWKLDLISSKMCTVQDYSSGIACRLFDVDSIKDPHILDMCAAPGGKSMQILDLLRGKGHLITNDIDAYRIGLLTENLQLSKYNNFSIRNENGKDLAGNFSHILIDAPCTGLGTWRKRADLRWNRTLDDIAKMNELQSVLLDKAAKLLDEGGERVYATCSIDPDENENVIDQFLNRRGDFRIVEMDIPELNKFKTNKKDFLLLPDELHDGAFAIKLIKSGPNK